jgi:cbb3-type cytochrome oxidase subunit 1
VVEARATTYQVEPDFAARQSIVWAIAWLIGGTTITLALHVLGLRPGLAGHFSFLSYGRLRAAADTALAFGWLATVGFAAIFAILPRISEVQLHNEALGAATTLTWSLILTGGIVALLLGVNQGRPLGELPAGADLGLAFMLALVVYNAGVTVVRRREQTLFVSGWYLLTAALVAPIVFVVGNLPSFSGVTSAIINGFYRNGLEMLWFVPVALAIAHYVVPVETGNPLYSAALARSGFWSLLLAGGWTGQRFLIKGPGPDYLEAIAVGMTVVLLVPILSSVSNLIATGRERWHLAGQAFGLRFAAAGLGLIVAWIALVVLGTVPSVSRFVGLTAWTEGVQHLAMFGVFSSFAFAFIYHAYPLMVGRDWYSRTLSAFHFWTTEVGVVVGTALLMAAGAAQAAAASVPGLSAPPPVPGVVTLLRILAALAFALVAVAQYAFAYNTFKTSRSGPFIRVFAGTAQVPVGGRV